MHTSFHLNKATEKRESTRFVFTVVIKSVEHSRQELWITQVSYPNQLRCFISVLTPVRMAERFSNPAIIFLLSKPNFNYRIVALILANFYLKPEDIGPPTPQNTPILQHRTMHFFLLFFFFKLVCLF